MTYGATHRDGRGKLISRQVTITPPSMPPCKCVGLYLWALVKFFFLQIYHRWRVSYAEKHRNDDIPEKYRGKSFYLTDDAMINAYDLVNNEFKLKAEEVNIVLNGSFLTENRQLKDGDQIKIFPLVAGG